MPIMMHCPFFKNEKLLRFNCEGVSIKFPDKQARRDHVKDHCANRTGWKECTIAQMLIDYYDRKDAER